MSEDDQKAFEAAWRDKTSRPDPQEVPVVQTMCRFFWAAACAYKEAEVVKAVETMREREHGHMNTRAVGLCDELNRRITGASEKPITLGEKYPNAPWDKD